MRTPQIEDNSLKRTSANALSADKCSFDATDLRPQKRQGGGLAGGAGGRGEEERFFVTHSGLEVCLCLCHCPVPGSTDA